MSAPTNHAIERIRVPLPAGFDAGRHVGGLLRKVAEKTGKDGWEMSSLDGDNAILTRHSAVTTVTATSEGKNSFDVRLPPGTKPSDGDKLAASLADTYSEYDVVMTRFEPFLGRATLTRMDEGSQRCRGAVAVALGVKPWDVQVVPTTDGGFGLELPKTYVSSKHYEKLVEVATDVVGTVGWRVKVDTQALTARFIPGDPPLFPKVVPYPMDQLGKGDVQLTPLGVTLPEEGVGHGPVEVIDWSASGFALVAGTPGSGKLLDLSTRLPVPVSEKFPTGWATVGSVDVGDVLVTREGKLAPVDSLTEVVERDMLRVTLSDGQQIIAGPEHLWLASDRRSRAHNRVSGSPNSAHQKRLSRDTRRTAERDRLLVLAQRYAEAKTWGTTVQIADIIGIKAGTVRSFVSASGIAYQVLPGKGSPRIFPVDEVIHRWLAHVERKADEDAARRTPELRVVQTSEMLQSVHDPDEPGRRNWAIPMSSAAQFPPAELPIDPYVLGAWLGDGHSNGGGFTGIDPEITDEIERCGFEMSHSARDPRAHRILGLQGLLREVGVLNDKHIPPVYLRSSIDQRLGLLQGLMDTDGTISPNGRCELSLCNKQLAMDALELIRSLGIKVAMKESPASYTSTDARTGEKTRTVTTTRYRMAFTPDMQVFRLPRKAERVRPAGSLRETQRWLYVTDIEVVGRTQMRCIGVADPDHTYLVEDFVPTHNTVALNSLIAQQLAEGAEVVIVDDSAKSIDFLWAKPFLREHGWGCDSEAHAVTALALVYEEGQRRAKVLAEKGVANWLNLPEKERFQPIFVVVDELSALTVTDPVPKGVPKDHPVVVEINQMNFLRALINRFINKIVAELRFVGVRMVLSTQVTNASTGLPPSLKNKIGHRVLAGSNPSRPARNQAFNDETGVVEVPEHVKSSGAHARGVGVADLEGHASVVYKSFFASDKDYAAKLRELGVPTNKKPSPTAAQVAEHAPDLTEDVGVPDRSDQPRGELTPSGKPVSSLPPELGPGPVATGADGRPLRGAAAAASALKGSSTPAPAGGPPMCPACDKPIDPTTGDCGCRW